jgi:tryptophan-rich sensory protein
MNEHIWYEGLKKPSWAPPAKIFMPVWIFLYVIIAWSFAFAFYGIAAGIFPLVVGIPFILNLIFNFAFTPIEFRLKNIVLALIDVLLTLGTLIWAMIAIFPFWAPIAVLNIPYLLWLIFASALQIAVVIKNR